MLRHPEALRGLRGLKRGPHLGARAGNPRDRDGHPREQAVHVLGTLVHQRCLLDNIQSSIISVAVDVQSGADEASKRAALSDLRINVRSTSISSSPTPSSTLVFPLTEIDTRLSGSPDFGATLEGK
ncbi:hypothetical protein B0H11DRAFT_2239315 [Mycena galericulata]|nr:hypothetical protein B0H11DRAFT_2239315 [Mycena galericulata]